MHESDPEDLGHLAYLNPTMALLAFPPANLHELTLQLQHSLLCWNNLTTTDESFSKSASSAVLTSVDSEASLTLLTEPCSESPSPGKDKKHKKKKVHASFKEFCFHL